MLTKVLKGLSRQELGPSMIIRKALVYRPGLCGFKALDSLSIAT